MTDQRISAKTVFYPLITLRLHAPNTVTICLERGYLYGGCAFRSDDDTEQADNCVFMWSGSQAIQVYII